MKPLPILAAVVLAITPAVLGQGMPGPKYNPATAKTARLFGKGGGFTATAQSSTVEGITETINELGYAVREGMVRIEMDLTKTKTLRKGKPIKSRDDDMEGMAGMGLAKQVTLVRPDKQATYIVYPGLKAYCEAPKKASDGESKSEWKEIGKDTVHIKKESVRIFGQVIDPASHNELGISAYHGCPDDREIRHVLRTG